MGCEKAGPGASSTTAALRAGLPAIFGDIAGQALRLLSGRTLGHPEPFRINEHIYATDGRIIVRTPIAEYESPVIAACTEYTGCSPSSYTQLPWQSAHYCQALTRLEDPGPPAREVCLRCKGNGKTRKRTLCPKCNGTGIETWTWAEEIAPGYHLGDGYVRLLLAHGVTGVFLPIDTDRPAEHWYPPVLFAHEEFEGLLMRRRL